MVWEKMNEDGVLLAPAQNPNKGPSEPLVSYKSQLWLHPSTPDVVARCIETLEEFSTPENHQRIDEATRCHSPVTLKLTTELVVMKGQ